MQFVSPTKGVMDFEEVFQDVLAFASPYPLDNYRLIIGTDSQVSKDETCFVTALVVHREGKGGRFYFSREKERHVRGLRQRIFYEASLSLALALEVTEALSFLGQDFNVEIHLDIGDKGATRDLIKEVVGMVVGSGFDARIKPDSYAATSVADRYTK